jgi:DNA-binding CsgD family transcriptional regulator
LEHLFEKLKGLIARQTAVYGKLRKVYRKLQVHSAPEAVARAIRERIV